MADTQDVVKALMELIHVFMRGSMSGFVRFARKSGLSMSQAGALFQLSRRGMHSGVSDIGGHLGVTSAAASQMLDRLVHQGLIMRSEDPADRRAKRIELTERGRKFVDEATAGRQRWFASMAERMSAEEQETVVAGLRILTAKLGEVDREIAPSDKPVDAKECAER